MGSVCIIIGYICSITFALVAITAGVLKWAVIPSIVHDMIIENVVLINDTIQFDRFETLPFPLHFKVHIFTVMNPYEVEQGAKPVMKEVGPYVYNQHVTRRMINITDDHLEYYEELHYEFNEELSAGSQDDEVTILHPAMISVMQIVEALLPGTLGVINTQIWTAFGTNSFWLTTTVRKLLFDGVHFCFTFNMICTIMRSDIFDIPSLRPGDVTGSLAFSFFHYKNSTPSGPYIVDRGLQDSDDLGRILSVGGASYLSYWLGNEVDAVDDVTLPSQCNMINGTNGAIYRPHVSEADTLMVFNSDICRSVKLHYQREVTYKGIRGLRFTTGDDMLDNTNRTCFCINMVSGFHQDEMCLFDGALDLMECQGSPIVATLPHMHLADDVYPNSIVGMSPVKEDHEIFVEIDPMSGTTLRGGKRLQFNMILRPVPLIVLTNNLAISLTPLLWVEEGMELPQEYVDELQSTLFDVLFAVEVGTLVGLAGGAVIACVLLILVIYCHCRHIKASKSFKV